MKLDIDLNGENITAIRHITVYTIKHWNFTISSNVDLRGGGNIEMCMSIIIYRHDFYLTLVRAEKSAIAAFLRRVLFAPDVCVFVSIVSKFNRSCQPNETFWNVFGGPILRVPYIERYIIITSTAVIRLCSRTSSSAVVGVYTPCVVIIFLLLSRYTTPFRDDTIM